MKKTCGCELMLECQCYLWLIDVLVYNMHKLIRTGLWDSGTMYCSLTNCGVLTSAVIYTHTHTRCEKSDQQLPRGAHRVMLMLAITDKNAYITLIRHNSSKKNRTGLIFFLICREKSKFYDGYRDICEKNSSYSVECVKLCKYLETKHVFTFKDTAEGGNKEFKIGQMYFKVETSSFKIKKKTYKYDNF